MVNYVIRRLLQSVVLLFVVTLVTFFLIHAEPGGPSMLNNPDLSRTQIEQMKESLGLNDPIPVQYARWLGNVVRGNLGVSYNTVQPVTALLKARITNTLLLSGVALVLSIAVAVPL